MPIPFQKPTAAQVFWLAASAVWVLLVFALIQAGFQPDHWRMLHNPSETSPYPTSSVAIFSLIILAEIAALGLITQPWRMRRLWLRLLIGAVPWLGWTALWVGVAMHQSPIRDVHLNWLLVATILQALTLLIVVPASIRRAFRR